MRQTLTATCLALLCAGCGGQYLLTVSDQVAPAGGEAAVVVRLQRSEFYMVYVAVKDAAIRLQVGRGKDRGAYTDALGYAGTTLPAPETVGRYMLSVRHLDKVNK